GFEWWLEKRTRGGDLCWGVGCPGANGPNGLTGARAPGLKRPQRAPLRPPRLPPAHAAPLQPHPHHLARRLRRAAADVPAVLPIPRVVRAVLIVREIADQLPQLVGRPGLGGHRLAAPGRPQGPAAPPGHAGP